jgi:hypothetical protein
MLDTVFDALKAIIGLRKAARDDKRAAIEIQKLEEELAAGKKNISPATLDDVKQYDPKFTKLLAAVLDHFGGGKEFKKRREGRRSAWRCMSQ